MNIKIIKTEKINKDYGKSTVELDNKIVEIGFWLDLINQWGKEDLKIYIYAEALKELNKLNEAHNLLKNDANGTFEIDENGNKIDNRNWKKNWIDSYPILANDLIDL